MKYIKQIVTKEDGRLMEYYWFKEADKCIEPEKTESDTETNE